MSRAPVGRWIAFCTTAVCCSATVAAEGTPIVLRPGPSGLPTAGHCGSRRAACLSLRVAAHGTENRRPRDALHDAISIAYQAARRSNESKSGAKRWHLDLGWRTVFPRLESTRNQLKRRLDIPLRTDTGRLFRRPDTPVDRRGRLGLNTFQLGIGRQETRGFLWTFYVGSLAGSDKTHQRVLTSNFSARFRYAYYFAKLGVEFYPWGAPSGKEYASWKERFGGSRPYVTSGFEVGFLNASAAGDFSVAPFKIYKDSRHVRDWLMSYSIGAGWAIPLGKRWSLHFAGDYSFHLYRPEEFNGWNAITTLRYRF